MPRSAETPEPWPRGKGYSDPLNDLPPFEGEPRSWIIACSQRCGSTLLGDLLGRSGRLGMPAEYLNFPWLGRQMAARFKMPPPEKGLPLNDYLRRLYRCRTSPEGFFGLKLQWHQYTRCRKSTEVARLMRSARYIHLTRKDIVAQAVSGTIAITTGRWHDRPHKAKAAPPVAFNRRSVDTTMRWILWENWSWQQYFAASGIQPLAVTYEDLVADTGRVCDQICRHIGLPNPPRFDLAQAATRPTSSERSAEWRKRYESAYALPPAPDGSTGG